MNLNERSIFIDYPNQLEHLGVGDWICHRSEWKQISEIVYSRGAYAVCFKGDVGYYDVLFPVARIAAPLYELLKRSDPYR